MEIFKKSLESNVFLQLLLLISLYSALYLFTAHSAQFFVDVACIFLVAIFEA